MKINKKKVATIYSWIALALPILVLYLIDGALNNEDLYTLFGLSFICIALFYLTYAHIQQSGGSRIYPELVYIASVIIMFKYMIEDLEFSFLALLFYVTIALGLVCRIYLFIVNTSEYNSPEAVRYRQASKREYEISKAERDYESAVENLESQIKYGKRHYNKHGYDYEIESAKGKVESEKIKKEKIYKKYNKE